MGTHPSLTHPEIIEKHRIKFMSAAELEIVESETGETASLISSVSGGNLAKLGNVGDVD